MAELTAQERLQPALLDRLTDDEPDNKREPREKRLITKQVLRRAVLRDLAWLFNASRPSDAEGFAHFPRVEASVLNFGLPSFSGKTASNLDVVELENSIRQVIVRFEPRIDPSTLLVRAMLSPTQMDHHNVISVQISGNLWAQPVPLELLLRTEVDLETGNVEIHDLTAAPFAPMSR
jgi:type VI secretion system protein ImpF